MDKLTIDIITTPKALAEWELALMLPFGAEHHELPIFWKTMVIHNARKF